MKNKIKDAVNVHLGQYLGPANLPDATEAIANAVIQEVMLALGAPILEAEDILRAARESLNEASNAPKEKKGKKKTTKKKATKKKADPAPEPEPEVIAEAGDPEPEEESLVPDVDDIDFGDDDDLSDTELFNE